jgi:replicative DNA helicase
MPRDTRSPRTVATDTGAEGQTRQQDDRRDHTAGPRHDQALDVAEVAVLGAALLSVEARDGLLKMLTPRDFARDAHGVVFDVIGQLVAAGTDVDLVTLTCDLADRDLLDEVGGADAVSRLSSPEACPSPAAWPAYATPVVREARRRRLRTVLAGALVRLDRGEDPNVVAAEIVTGLEVAA